MVYHALVTFDPCSQIKWRFGDIAMVIHPFLERNRIHVIILIRNPIVLSHRNSSTLSDGIFPDSTCVEAIGGVWCSLLLWRLIQMDKHFGQKLIKYHSITFRGESHQSSRKCQPAGAGCIRETSNIIRMECAHGLLRSGGYPKIIHFLIGFSMINHPAGRAWYGQSAPRGRFEQRPGATSNRSQKRRKDSELRFVSMKIYNDIYSNYNLHIYNYNIYIYMYVYVYVYMYTYMYITICYFWSFEFLLREQLFSDGSKSATDPSPPGGHCQTTPEAQKTWPFQ